MYVKNTYLIGSNKLKYDHKSGSLRMDGILPGTVLEVFEQHPATRRDPPSVTVLRDNRFWRVFTFEEVAS